MRTFLLHDPWVQIYLLYAAALFVAGLWDFLHKPPAGPDNSRTPRKEGTQGAPGRLPSAAGQNPPRSVSRPGRPTDKEGEPIGEGGRPQSPIDPTPAPNPTNRRECHVVTW
jgi:hypothetical protein